jgi:hypothetical protein
MIEVITGVQPFMQPHPYKSEGGDCFACAPYAALRYLFLDKEFTFEDIWECCVQNYTDKGEPIIRRSWGVTHIALGKARQSLGLGIEWMYDVVEPLHWREKIVGTAWYHRYPSDSEYINRLEAYLSSGWIALIEMAYDGGGPYKTNGQRNHCDHIALIDGVRSYWEKHESLKASYQKSEIHIVCSAKGAYWMPLKEAMESHGISGWLLLRKDRRY